LRVSSNPTAGSISLDPDQAPGRGLFAQPTVKALEASGAKTTDAGHVDRKGAAGVQALQRRPYRRRQAHSCALRRFGPVAPQALPTYHRNRDMSALRNEPAPFCAFYG